MTGTHRPPSLFLTQRWAKFLFSEWGWVGAVMVRAGKKWQPTLSEETMN